MRVARFRWLLLGAVALVFLGSVAGCENPFDPLNKSEKIQGLSYVDFSSVWDRWDSDPEYDGVTISVEYFNEFGDTLSFRDKPHEIVVEFWTSRDTTVVEPTTTTASLIGRKNLWAAKTRNAGRAPLSAYGLIVQEKLWFSKTIAYSNSDDDIRIPLEAYSRFLPECDPVTTTVGTETTTTVPAPEECEHNGFMVLRVFPPQAYPRPELTVAQWDVVLFKPVVQEGAPND